MSWSKVLLRVVLPAVIAVAVVGYYLGSGDSTIRYVTAKLSRGSIVRSVVATGTVNPVTTVQVGSYVSGPIQAIYADFNSPVKAGQLIAKIDPRPFAAQVALASAAVANAKAQLEKDRANLNYQKVTFERDRDLLAQSVLSHDQFDSQHSLYQQALAQVGLDEANVRQQEATLRAAELNLNYTSIVSPVDGTVVSRNVDVGQTVAASFQTPTLFLIAKDLTKMQVDTNVSESDIGDVQPRQRAEFKVDAFPDRVFEGAVSQVRQAPITVQNVVTYDVVVNVANPELLLKPGMTANVTVITARRDDVVRIPEQALRFSPQGLAGGGAVGLADNGEGGSRRGRVWIESGDGLKPVTVTTGLDDGTNAELLSGDLHEGEAVVVDAVRTSAAGSNGRSRPLRFPH